MIFFWWIGFLIVLFTIGATLVSFVKIPHRWEETWEKTEADKKIDDLNIINSLKSNVKEELEPTTNNEPEDEELARPLEITDLRSYYGAIYGIARLKSGNFGLCAYGIYKKKWYYLNLGDIGKYLHPQYGISSYDDDAIKYIKEHMTDEMVENEVYHKYFK
tara:strand:+ start:30 stop:512 length:483 start_codon:yes stop_codon:yes gene_type:complete